MLNDKKIGVVVVAAGSGKRAKKPGKNYPKQYHLLGGKAVLARSIECFLEHDAIDWVLPVIGEDHKEFYSALALENQKLLAPCIGGAERQESCLAGLSVLREYNPDLVLIHDAARPIVSSDLIDRVCLALEAHDGTLPSLPITDTIKFSSDGETIEKTVDRHQLWAAQTPQGFVFEKIYAAHEAAAKEPSPFTDDASIAEWAGLNVALVKGDQRAMKITAPEDFVRAEMLLNEGNAMETRVGSGMDIHQFEPGESVRLGGIDIAHDAQLKGHSDADAALHVLTDALLGALADGDIGTHFPPNEEKWKGEPSKTFLSFAAGRVKELGGRIVHLDLTINCEAPKIGPVADEIRENIAQICDISTNRVSVKATTSEKMGFVGRGEGLMTLGTATIEVPREVE